MKLRHIKCISRNESAVLLSKAAPNPPVTVLSDRGRCKKQNVKEPTTVDSVFILPSFSSLLWQKGGNKSGYRGASFAENRAPVGAVRPGLPELCVCVASNINPRLLSIPSTFSVTVFLTSRMQLHVRW